jgi:hypothetical protein
MSHVQPKQYFADTHRAVLNADAIEWEELPSLAGSLSQRMVRRGNWQAGSIQRRGANDSAFMSTASAPLSPWDATMPAMFDPSPISQPFHEALEGLSSREVVEPDVFEHFFGAYAER